jgi:hypothetical protein
VHVYEANIRSSPVYTQWPEPLPGTTVEAVPDPADPNRWRLTVRDFPVRLGYNQFGVEISPGCGGAQAYFQFNNGEAPTSTPRPDACGGLGLPAEATVLTFEDYGVEFHLERLAREQGVRFEGSADLRGFPGVAPRSGYRMAASQEGLEFGSAMLPIRIAFDRPLSALGVFVGVPERQWAVGDVTASLSAYGYHAGGDALELLGSDSTTFPAMPSDVTECLRFTAAEGDIIARALIEYTDSGGTSIAERRLMDDLTLVFADAELPPDRPPTVEITSPIDGSSIPGTTVNLRATIREDVDLERVAYQIDGGPEAAVGAWPSTTDPVSYFTGANFSTALLEPGVPHLLTVTAYDGIGQFAQDTVTVIVPTPVPTIDIQAVKMEVVQVVQCLDNDRCADNAVPMVLNKPTWVRLYVRAEGGTPRRPISGRLCRGRVATCDSGMALSINEIVPDEDEDPVSTDRGNLDASLNFIVPPVWLAEGALDLTAFANYREEDMDEILVENNVVQASVAVTRPRSLTVMFMPTTSQGITAPLSEMWPIVDWLARVFPVARVAPVARAPLRGDFDLSDSSGDGCGRTWSRLMDALRGAYAWGGPGSAYLFGMVPEGVPTDGVGGCGERPGHVASGIVTPGRRQGAVIAAQELGHNFGRRHAPGCGAANPDGGYPRRSALLDEWGIDLALRQIYPKDSSYDYMGYCGGQDDTWTSVYTYLTLHGALPVADAGPSAARLAAPFVAEGEPSLIGGGRISPEGFALERGFYRAAVAEGVEDNLPDGPYTAMLLDGAGAALYSRDFGVIELSNHEPGEAGYVQLILPDFPDVADIVFLYNGAEIGRVSASANAPQVAIVEPAGGEDWGASGAHTIAWQASDADGDPLRFTVQYSQDGGASWSAAGVDLTDVSSLAVDSVDLPGGSLLFRVLASDGLNTTESATTSPVSVADKPPQIHLASPVEGDWLPAGEAVVFRGYAVDFEDVIVADDAYRWTSDLDGDLGSGPTLWGVALSQGLHHITLTVTDRAGNAVSQAVSITIGGSPEAEARRPSPLALAMVGLGALLLLAVGVGVLVYVLRSRPARR